MIIEKVESKGLAHYSYLIGNEGIAAVIDPRRDVHIYLDLAAKHDLEIKYIFETHRNEDYVVGSMELSDLTGAQILISGHEDLGYEYGDTISDGTSFDIGGLTLQAIHTPGHTLGHLCYALYDEGEETPFIVFTGDTLFAGDLGRTDFYGEENLDKMTGLLYDSVFEKLMPLGDQVVTLPAHGAGSACGDSMDERPLSTLGYERLTNDHLQVDSRDEFIDSFGRMRIKPRYFTLMEKYNVKGAPFVGDVSSVPCIKVEDLKEEQVLLDVRSKEAFIERHIPGSHYLSMSNLSTYLGTLFAFDTPIVLIVEDANPDFLEEVKRQMLRVGFDRLEGYLEGGVESFAKDESTLQTMPTIQMEALKELQEGFVILDIRDGEQVPEWMEDKTVRIPLKELYKRYDELDKDLVIYTLCASGNRSATASSFLINHGYETAVIAGGVKAL